MADLYYLKYEDIYNLDGFKEKSARNLIDAIELSKKNPLGDLIFGLGINHIGKKLLRFWLKISKIYMKSRIRVLKKLLA